MNKPIDDYNAEAPLNTATMRLSAAAAGPSAEPNPEPIPDPYGVGQDALLGDDDLDYTPDQVGHGPVDLHATPPSTGLWAERADNALTAPAKWGWRGRINAAFGTHLAPKDTSAESGFRESVQIVQSTLPGAATIAIANPKGGTGNTPTALMLSAILGEHRGRGVVTVDMSEHGGTLGSRASRTATPERTTWDLLDAASHLTSPHAESGELASFLRRQPTRDEILAGDSSSFRGDLGWDECAAIGAVLRRYREIVIVDTANNPQAGAWQWAIRNADVLVVPLPVRRDIAQHVYTTLAGLRRDGWYGLLESAVVLLCATPGSNPALTDDVVTELEALGVRTFLEVPYEPMLASGERIVVEDLSEQSTEAWTNVAGAVVSALIDRIHDRRARTRMPAVQEPEYTTSEYAAVDAQAPTPEPEPDRQWRRAPAATALPDRAPATATAGVRRNGHDRGPASEPGDPGAYDPYA